MTKEDILHMAYESGFNWPAVQTTTIEQRLERFAALVAAAEREACAAHYLEVMRNAIEEEREACAEIADAEMNHYSPEAPVTQYQSGIFTAAEHIAETIRARGNSA